MNDSTPNQQWHTLVTTVENKPGVLARVSGLFSRRNYNIHSLAVAPAASRSRLMSREHHSIRW